ncbi:MAG: hypothetical protein N2450_04190 [bacterium]|nr:hypothetical protein [bacterium]
MKLKQYFFVVASLIIQMQTNAMIPSDFNIHTVNDDFNLSKIQFIEDIEPNRQGRLLSNSIIDQKVDSLRNGFWIATGEGLNFWNVLDSSWLSITSNNHFGRGGVSAIQTNTSAIWAATAYDTIISGVRYPAGGGIGYSTDNGINWRWFPQPVDSRDITEYRPTTTNVQNLTYDLAITSTAVWAASFGGGLRKFSFSDSIWRVRPPDANPFSALNYLNHRAFSVFAENDSIIWVGTAAGINRSTNGGNEWQNFRHSPADTLTITGNFVVAIHLQKYNNRKFLWASTWKAEGATEEYGISVTEDNGITWRRTLKGEKIHNITSIDSIVYAVGPDGLFKSIDFGVSWWQFPPITSSHQNLVIGEQELYSVATGFNRLLVGGPDGWAVSSNSGNSWSIGRAFESTRQVGQPQVYAYPNPFSPQRFSYVRFQYHLDAPEHITITLYSFALEKVGTIVSRVYRPAGDNQEVWNGQINQQAIANGVYFYRLEKGKKETWGKLIILD